MFTILLPLIRPAVATVTVLHAIGIWNELILATNVLSTWVGGRRVYERR